MGDVQVQLKIASELLKGMNQSYYLHVDSLPLLPFIPTLSPGPWSPPRAV